MTRTEIVSFTDEYVDGAAALLAERLTRQRAAEPLLALDDPAAAIRGLLERGNAGAVAVREGEVEAFILARIEDDEIFGRNAWIDAAGSATRDPELLRDVYESLADRWVGDGYRRHHAVVPVLPEELDPWYRLASSRCTSRRGSWRRLPSRPRSPTGSRSAKPGSRTSTRSSASTS